jgi:NAD+ synthase (glutamine-hydrolysing)
MKIALAQINTTIGDFDGNFNKIISYSKNAVKENTDLIIFPELAITGYPPLDLLENENFIKKNLHYIEKIKNLELKIAILAGFVDRNISNKGRRLFNAVKLIYGKKEIATIHKTLLPTYDVFDESRYFETGINKSPVKFRNINAGIAICEDIWTDGYKYKANPAEMICKRKPDIFITVSASPYEINKNIVRENILKKLSKKYYIPSLFINLVGGNDSLVFDGSSFAVNKEGKVCLRAKSFAEDLVIFDTENEHRELPCLEIPDEENILNALKLGLKDYISKTGFKTVVIGLSGGIDSALTAAIAVMALGSENVTGITMPSRYSSKESVTDSEKLARNLHINLIKLPVDSIFQAFLDDLASIFNNKTPDVTEENLQSRIRGVILMAFSNKFGSMVLNTGNKSELATGYCTLYGDMAGGFAVLADIDKTAVYKLAGYINREKEIIPDSIFKKPPSAELKPGQKDEDTLPPYPVLDPVINKYVENNMTVDKITGMGFDRDTVISVVSMINRSEYKRKQAAPGIKITSKAFGEGRKIPMAHRFKEE